MIIAKKYRSNSVTERRTHWSLKTRCGMLPSNIARKPKFTSGPSFLLKVIVDGIDVMAALQYFF